MIGWVAGKLASKAAPYVVVGLAALCVILWGGTVYLRLVANAAEARAEKAEAQLEVAADANQSNVDTITSLRAALADAIRQNQVVDQAAAEIEQQRRDYMTRLQRENLELRKQRETEYATDSECAALRATPVCRAVNDRLRALASPDGDG